MDTPTAYSPTRYSKVAIWLHWIIAFMIIGQIVGGIVMHKLPLGEQKYQMYQMHKSFGIMVLILSMLRLLWRLTHKAPSLPAGMKSYERVLARLTHILLYVLMIGTPFLGWLYVSASPTQIPTKLFALIPWPDFPGISRSKSLSDILSEVHEIMAFAIIGLLVLHIGGALKHHFINKDDVLTRMIPFLKPKSR